MMVCCVGRGSVVGEGLGVNGVLWWGEEVM